MTDTNILEMTQIELENYIKFMTPKTLEKFFADNGMYYNKDTKTVSAHGMSIMEVRREKLYSNEKENYIYYWRYIKRGINLKLKDLLKHAQREEAKLKLRQEQTELSPLRKKYQEYAYYKNNFEAEKISILSHIASLQKELENLENGYRYERYLLSQEMLKHELNMEKIKRKLK